MKTKGNFFEIKNNILYITITGKLDIKLLDFLLEDLKVIKDGLKPGDKYNTILNMTGAQGLLLDDSKNKIISALKPLAQYTGETAIVVTNTFISIAARIIVIMAGMPRTKVFTVFEDAEGWMKRITIKKEDNK